MRPPLVVVAMLVASAVPRGGLVVSARLEGCQDPGVIAKGLGGLRGKDWGGITLAVLQKMWPTQVHALDCQDGKSCRAGWSEDRIISGECECCELFNFSVRASDGGPATEHLDNIVIHYSASSREEVVRSARTFATALGMPMAKLGLVGQGDSADLSWKDERNGFLSGLNLKFTGSGSSWKVYFNFSRYAL